MTSILVIPSEHVKILAKTLKNDFILKFLQLPTLLRNQMICKHFLAKKMFSQNIQNTFF